MTQLKWCVYVSGRGRNSQRWTHSHSPRMWGKVIDEQTVENIDHCLNLFSLRLCTSINKTGFTGAARFVYLVKFLLARLLFGGVPGSPVTVSSAPIRPTQTGDFCPLILLICGVSAVTVTVTSQLPAVGQKSLNIDAAFRLCRNYDVPTQVQRLFFRSCCQSCTTWL